LLPVGKGQAAAGLKAVLAAGAAGDDGAFFAASFFAAGCFAVADFAAAFFAATFLAAGFFSAVGALATAF
jgi:hypothetical protein